jgi:hypothetical protein
MIDFVTLSVPVPHPTLSALLVYWIIGALVVFVAGASACCRNRYWLRCRPWHDAPVDAVGSILLWPVVLWVWVRDA